MITIYRDISGSRIEVEKISKKNAIFKTAIMGLDEIQASIVVDSVLDIEEGDYILHNDIRYVLNREAEYEIRGDVNYSYDLIFEHPQYTLINKLLAHNITGSTSFTLTGKLADFVSLLVGSINVSAQNPTGVDTGWSVGNIIDTDYRAITIEDLDCRESLKLFAKEFDAEYYFTGIGKTINFVDRIENVTSLVFEQGREKGLYKITQRNVDKEDTVTRVYVRGGNKNVSIAYADEEGYLKLPENYLENFSEHSKVVEKKIKFEDEFPKFIGSIATVSGENNKVLTCPEIDFDIAAIAVGDNARINFLTGDLMGKSFKLQWQNSNKQITLIEQEDETALPDSEGVKPNIPNASKKAEVGDTFNFTGVLMPESYVNASITRLREKGNKNLAFYSKKRVKYSLDIDHRYLRNKPVLKIGDLVTLIIKSRYITLRITELEVNHYSGQLSATVSNYLEENWERYIEGRIEGVKNELSEKEIIIRDAIGRSYLRKDIPDFAAEVITFLKGLITAALEVGGESLFRGLARVLEGIQFGESFIPGLTGLGGLIDGSGKAELDALSLRKWLEVPELRYNRVEVTIGDKWSAPGAGIIESVDTENKVIKLKLEEGEIGTFDVDDICMGIYHSLTSEDNATSSYDDSKGNRRFAGFATSYFRIIQVMDNQRSTLRYELRHISGSHPNPVHPSQFMHAVAYGNFTNADRQTSNYQTRTYTRYLKGVRDWEFTINNIAAQFGNLDNLNIFGLEMSGYSIYLNNVYFTGIIYQLSQQIQDELNKQQIGGKNLLREYDIRFGFKYWGGTGEFSEVDLDTLQNQPYLNVSPAQILWVFPEREADVNVESNTNWLVE